MALFARKEEKGVQAFVVSLLNQNCHALRDKLDGPRLEGRVNLTTVVMVVPVEEKEPQIRQVFTAITKEFSSSGVAVVVDHPCGPDEALLGFRWRGNITWIRAKAKHLHPMGGGFFQLGFRMTQRLHSADYPELAKLVF
ncbi:MAG: hypothetical protein ABSG53_05440 [Thermoguttaceae bacterium]|jgi:hypothetical protein